MWQSRKFSISTNGGSIVQGHATRSCDQLKRQYDYLCMEQNTDKAKLPTAVDARRMIVLFYA